MPDYNTTIPAASEAYKPANYDAIYIDRYLYPWLSDADAQAAAAIGAAVTAGTETGYDYPEGYSTNQTTEGPPAGGGLGGNPALWDVAYTISVTVTNVGSGGNSTTSDSPMTNTTTTTTKQKRAERSFSGKAVAQAYVQFPTTTDASYDTPVVQLRDFAKTGTLAPGEAQTVELTFTRKDVSVWDVVAQNWVVPEVDGDYTFWVGGASDALFLGCSAATLVCEEGLTPPV